MKKLFVIAFAFLAIGFISCETVTPEPDQTDTITEDNYSEVIRGANAALSHSGAPDYTILRRDKE